MGYMAQDMDFEALIFQASDIDFIDFCKAAPFYRLERQIWKVRRFL